MSKPTKTDFTKLLDGMFADVLGFTKHEWQDIADLATQMSEANLFKSDPIKCTVAAFILWFEMQGYLAEENIPETGMH